MPESTPNPGPAPAKNDVVGNIAEKLAAGAIARFFGDIPEAEKADILDALVNNLDELTTINRYFAEQLFNKFGDEETGEFRKKPDIRDFLTAWAEATLRLMTEEEMDAQGDGEEDVEEEPGDGEDENDVTNGTPDGPVIAADYRVSRPK
jgi:hypothetical protein